MEAAHQLILLGGALELASIFACLASARLGVPSLPLQGWTIGQVGRALGLGRA